jgi:anthranilate synthase component II
MVLGVLYIAKERQVMLLLIDNYDSFTYNLLHYVAVLGVEVQVVRHDALTAEQALALKPEAILLSPGPCSPDQAGICLEVVGLAADQGVPLLGVCLGHQTIGQAYGGKVVRAPAPVHGRTSEIVHTHHPLFSHLPNPFTATRYHSLIVDRLSWPPALIEIAYSMDDDMPMALAHTTLPIYGVQFHPESFASMGGHQLLWNFMALAKGRPCTVYQSPKRLLQI